MAYPDQKQRANIFLALLMLIGVLFFAIWFIYSPYLRTGLFVNVENISPEEERELIEKGQRHRIDITSQGFVPERLTIKQFDTVTFVNRDQAQHKISSEDAKSKTCASLAIPQVMYENQSASVVLARKGKCNFFDELSKFPHGQITIERLSQ